MSGGIKTLRPSAEESERMVHGLTEIWKEVGTLPHLSRTGVCLHVLAQVWRSTVRAPVTALLTTFTIAVALFLLGAFVEAAQNIGQRLEESRRGLAVSIFLADAVKPESFPALAAELERLPMVQAVAVRDKAAALDAFRRALGEQASLLEGLEGQNPLPASLEVTLKPGAGGEFEKVVEGWGKRPEVEHIQFDRGLLSQLSELIAFLSRIGWLGMLCMLVVIGFIIANTIRLALASHRHEIEIMRLVGAARGLVRAPYMIEGWLQGLLAGVLSVGALYLATQAIADLVRNSPVLVAFFPDVLFISPLGIALILCVGMGVGLGASYLVVRRFGDV